MAHLRLHRGVSARSLMMFLHCAFVVLCRGNGQCPAGHRFNPAANEMMFEGVGASGIYQNRWYGWYSSDTRFTAPAGDHGKYAAYNTLLVHSLRFEDDRGTFVTYDLAPVYAGRSLLDIAQQCLPQGSKSQNDGSNTWTNGHCTDVGSMAASNAGSMETGQFANLRIGVGDGSEDPFDWVLFMPVSGNGLGDYNGYNIWSFGGEIETNNGYPGVVRIIMTKGCQPCAVGHFQDQSGAQGCKSCAVGQFQDQVGQSGCKACIEGTFVDEGGADTCKHCVPGRHADAPGLGACKECGAGQHQDQSQQSSCKACPGGRSQGQSGSVVCQPCSAGFYSNVEGLPACKACNAGRFVAVAGSYSCESCPAGQHSGVAASECVQPTPAPTPPPAPCTRGSYGTGGSNCTECPAGQHQGQVGQRSCEGALCAPGTYFEQIGQVAAVTCKMCPAGQHQARAGQRLCSKCTGGEHQDVVGQSACKGALCAEGKYFESTAAQTAPAVCSDCAMGTFQDQRGQTSCVICDIGRYQDQAAQPSCIVCPAGKTTEQAGSRYRSNCSIDSALSDCQPGFFPSNNGTMQEISRIRSKQLFDKVSASTCSGELKTRAVKTCSFLCEPCPAGRYQPVYGPGNQGACKQCAAGQYQPFEGQAGCLSCGVGQYGAADMPRNASSHCVACPLGKHQAVAGSSTCADCTPGKHGAISASGVRGCNLCAKGRFQPISGAANASSCIVCVDGQYQPLEGQAGCLSCGVGQYGAADMPRSASSHCVACPLGKHQAIAGASSCTDCSAGKHGQISSHGVRDSEATACATCGTGQHQDETGQASCKQCRAGYRCISGREQHCPTRTYQDATGASNCLSCPQGKHQDQEGQSQCKDCAPGRVAELEAALNCRVCESGRFADAGTSQCKVCPHGKYAFESAQTECEDCVSCPALHYRQGCTTTAMGSCLPCESCPKGYSRTECFEDRPGFCQYSRCPFGEFENATSNTCVKCALCPAGTFRAGCAGQNGGRCLECGKGQFKSHSVSVLWNTTCSLCTAGQYQATTGKGACDPCPAGQYQTLSGAAYCTKCDAGTFGHGNVSISASHCKVCPAGKHQDVAGSASCKICTAGRFTPPPQPESGAPVCSPFTVCTPGQYVVAHPNTTADRICKNCAAGYFSNTTDVRTCSSCPSGKYQQTSGQTYCDVKTPCTPGKYDSNPKSVSDERCVHCPEGKFSSGLAALTCTVCRNGTFQERAGQAFCSQHSVCTAGRFVQLSANATFDRVCADCDVQTFSNVTNSRDCTVCPAGKYQMIRGQSYCDAKTPCTPGRYDSNPKSIDEGRCKDCPAGKFSNTLDVRSCTVCSSSKFQNESGQAFCSQHSVCTAGQYVHLEANSTFDRICVDCDAMMFSSFKNENSCTVCPNGKYQEQRGKSYCEVKQPCVPGQYEANTSSLRPDRCLPCSAGRSSSTVNAANCDECSHGHFSAKQGSTICLECTPGKFVAEKRATSCTECPAGKYQSQAAQKACIECPDCRAGAYPLNCGGASNGTCEPCAAGRYFEESIKDCMDCEAGKYQNLREQTSCNDCGAGRWQSERRSLSCHACEAGQYQPHLGATSHSACKKCAKMTYQPAPGQAECKACLQTADEYRACPEGKEQQVICKANEFVQKGTQRCVTCPSVGPLKEAVCHNGVLRMNEGFWSSAVPKSDTNLSLSAAIHVGDTPVDKLTVFAKCPCPHCCRVDNYTGALTCTNGTSGILCAVCKKGTGIDPRTGFDEGTVRYHRTINDLCVKCPDEDLTEYLKSQTVPFITVGLLFGLLVSLLAMDSRSEWGCGRRVQKRFQGLQRRFYAKGKVMFSFGQIATLFLGVYDVPFPQEFRDFIKNFAFFNVDIFRWIPLDCYFDFHFHHGLLLSTLGMLSLPIFAAASIWAIKWAEQVSKKSNKRIRNIGIWVGQKAGAVVQAILFIAFAVYPMVSAKIFKTFNCGKVTHANNETTEYLKADYSIHCDSEEHKYWQRYASAMIILISFGTPVLYAFLLKKNRVALANNDRSVEHLLFLSQDYKEECYWWEVVETTRKLLLTGVAVFIKRDTILQVVVALVGAIMLLALLVRWKPYRNEEDSKYAIHVNAAMVIYIFLGLLLKVNSFLVNFMNATGAASSYVLDKQGYRASTLAYFLIFTVSGVLISFVVHLRHDFKKLQRDKLMRYSDQSLVYFPKPALPQSFDLMICSAKDEIGEAEQIRDELHTLVHTMGVKIHRTGTRKPAERPALAKMMSTRSKKKLQQATAKEIEELHVDTIKEELKQKKAIAFVLSKDFFTELRCVKTLKIAHGFVQEYAALHRKAELKARRKFAGPRQIIFLLDGELTSKDELVTFATTQNDRKRMIRDKRVGNANLVADNKMAMPVSDRRLSGLDAEAVTRPEGELLHEWLQEFLPLLLGSVDAGSDNNEAAKLGEANVQHFGYSVVPRYLDKFRIAVTLKRLVQEALFVGFDGEHLWSGEPYQRPEIFIPGELKSCAIELPKALRKVHRLEGAKDIRKGLAGQFRADQHAYKLSKHLYISPQHHMSKVLEAKLRQRLGGEILKITRNVREMQECSHMLVVFDAGSDQPSKAQKSRVSMPVVLSDEKYIAEIEQARNFGLVFIALGVGKQLDVAPFMDSKHTHLAGIARGTSGSKIIPCPDCVTMLKEERERWHKEHPNQFHPADEAREDFELEQIALARVGLALSDGVVTARHKRTVRTIAHKVAKEYHRASKWRLSRRRQSAPDGLGDIELDESALAADAFVSGEFGLAESRVRAISRSERLAPLFVDNPARGNDTGAGEIAPDRIELEQGKTMQNPLSNKRAGVQKGQAHARAVTASPRMYHSDRLQSGGSRNAAVTGAAARSRVVEL